MEKVEKLGKKGKQEKMGKHFFVNIKKSEIGKNVKNRKK